MHQKTVESIINHMNNAKRDMENFPTSGMSEESMEELNLAYHLLNDSINHCNSAMRSI